MKIRLLIYFLIPLVCTACYDDDSTDVIIVDLESFDHVTDQYPYEDVSPFGEDSYWDLNWTDGTSMTTVFSNGELCASNVDPMCEENFSSLGIPSSGFANNCLPARCYHYIRSNVSFTNRIYNSTDEVAGFIGTVNSPGEALLFAFANGYYLNTDDKSASAVKETDNGYELLVLALVSDCTPVQTNRFHLRVRNSGRIKILGVEVYEMDENACI